ncbi:hypothetical protein [Evansella vedderi]|nr:hypothetical protein [Evansella vedderi]
MKFIFTVEEEVCLMILRRIRKLEANKESWGRISFVKMLVVISV